MLTLMMCLFFVKDHQYHQYDHWLCNLKIAVILNRQEQIYSVEERFLIILISLLHISTLVFFYIKESLGFLNTIYRHYLYMTNH